MFDRPYYPLPRHPAWLQRGCIGVLLWSWATWQPVAAAPALDCHAHSGEMIVLVRFKSGSAALDAPSIKRLNAVLSQDRQQTATPIVIEGFAGKGKVSPDYALALGNKYAQTVQQHMLGLGAAPERISVLSLGQNGSPSARLGACIRWQPRLIP